MMTGAQEAKRPFFTPKEGGAAFCFSVIAIIAGQLLIMIPITVAGIARGNAELVQELAEGSFWFNMAIIALNQAVMLCVFFFVYRMGGVCPLKAAQIRGMDAAGFGMSVILGVAALFSIMFTSFTFDLLIYEIGYKEPASSLSFDSAENVAAGVFFVALLPAVIEELIYRGILLNSMRNLGRRNAVLISAAAFSLMHMNPLQTVHQFLLGIVFALVAWETGSIIAPMIMHFLNNFIAIMLDFWGFDALIEPLTTWQVCAIAAATLAAGAAILYGALRLYRRIKKPRGTGADCCAEFPDKTAWNERNCLTYFTVAFTVCAAMWLFTLVGNLI